MDESQHSNLLLIRERMKPKEQPAEENYLMSILESGEETRFNFEKVLMMDYCLLFFAFVNAMLSLFYYEADYSGKTRIAQYCLKFMIPFTIISSTCGTTQS
jgi:hypothetical protein